MITRKVPDGFSEEIAKRIAAGPGLLQFHLANPVAEILLSRSAGRPLAAVTGASSGIGAVFAEMLAARGMDLIVIARRRDRLEALARKLRDEAGAAVTLLVADLTDPEDLRKVEASLARAQIDLLINCAGFGTYEAFHRIEPERIKKELMLDLIVPAALARAVIPAMLARGQGDILNVCSMAGFIPIPRHAAYSAAKAGLIRLTEALHGELAGTGVRVFGLCPGPVPTEFFAISGFKLEDVPPYLLQSAAACVEAALKSRERSQVLTIPHRFVRMFVAALRLLPLGLRVAILGGGPAWLNTVRGKPVGAPPLRARRGRSSWLGF